MSRRREAQVKEGRALKLWVDDERPAPPGWLHIMKPSEAILTLATQEVEQISLDHDMQEWIVGQELTGYDVLKVIEERVYHEDDYEPPIIHIHTDNAGGRRRMELAISSINRALTRRV